MKKFIFIVMFILMTIGFAEAQTWYSANQKTVAWDAVTALADGSPIPADSSVQYRVFIAPSTATGEDQKIEMGIATGTNYLITLTTQGRYWVGIRSELVSNSVVVAQSAISWSDDSSKVPNGQTWGLSSFTAPAGTKGLRTQ